MECGIENIESGTIDLGPVDWDLLNWNVLSAAKKEYFNIEGPSLQVLGRKNSFCCFSSEDFETTLSILQVVIQNEPDEEVHAPAQKLPEE